MTARRDDVVGRHDAAGRLHDEQRAEVAGAAQLLLEVLRCTLAIRGATYAFTSVVETRSNSGPRGMTSCESEMCSTSGNSSRTISRVRRSCAGFTNENRYITAIERTPSFFRRCTPRRTASSSSASSGVALEVHALRDRDARPPARDRDRARIVRVPDLFLVAAAQLDLVAVALGDEQPGRRAVHLDHRVVGGGGAVHEDVEVAAERVELDAEALGELLEPVHHARRLVVERGRRLVEHDLARGRDADQVGERAADIDSYPETHVRLVRLASRSRERVRARPRRSRA